jgi:hypothetical protein
MHKPIHLKKCGGALCQQRFKITQSGAPSTSGLGMKHLHAALQKSAFALIDA